MTTLGMTLAELKAKMLGSGRDKAAADDLLVTAGTKILDDNKATIADLGLQHGQTLSVDARLLGGKVHGSLARAGKVRADLDIKKCKKHKYLIEKASSKNTK